MKLFRFIPKQFRPALRLYIEFFEIASVTLLFVIAFAIAFVFIMNRSIEPDMVVMKSIFPK